MTVLRPISHRTSTTVVLLSLLTFTKDMTGITKFWWDFDDGSPMDSVTASPVHIFTNTNATSIEYYDVTLTVQSPGGCLDNLHLNDNSLPGN